MAILRSKRNTVKTATDPASTPVSISSAKQTKQTKGARSKRRRRDILASTSKAKFKAIRGSWTVKDLDAAINDVEDNIMSIRAAGREYGIPESTIRNHLYGRSQCKQGKHSRYLSDEEESEIVNWCLRNADEGRGVTIGMLKEKVAEICVDRLTPFKNGIPGRKWWQLFHARHPEVSLRSAETLDTARARALSEKNLDAFYNGLQNVYDEFQFPPSKIWNADETGVQAGKVRGMKIIARRGARNVHEVVMQNREWVTILACCNAEGYRLPSYYIFKGKRLRGCYINGCERGARQAVQDRAWMTSELFKCWLIHFKKNVPGGVDPSNPHLIILDGHGSHVDDDVILIAKEMGIHLYVLPPHTSHKLQPLDVACFAPFKTAFQKYRAKYMLERRWVEPSKEDLATLIWYAIRDSLTDTNIRAGFRATGIWPLNKRAVLPNGVVSDALDEGHIGNTPQNQPTMNHPVGHFVDQSIADQYDQFGDQYDQFGDMSDQESLPQSMDQFDQLEDSSDEGRLPSQPMDPRSDDIEDQLVPLQRGFRCWESSYRQPLTNMDPNSLMSYAAGTSSQPLTNMDPNSLMPLTNMDPNSLMSYAAGTSRQPLTNMDPLLSYAAGTSRVLPTARRTPLFGSSRTQTSRDENDSYHNVASQPTNRGRKAIPDLRGVLHVSSDEWCRFILEEKARKEELEIQKQQRMAEKKLEQEKRKALKEIAAKEAKKKKEERHLKKMADELWKLNTQRLRDQLYAPGRMRLCWLFGMRQYTDEAAKARRQTAILRLKEKRNSPRHDQRNEGCEAVIRPTATRLRDATQMRQWGLQDFWTNHSNH